RGAGEDDNGCIVRAGAPLRQRAVGSRPTAAPAAVVAFAFKVHRLRRGKVALGGRGSRRAATRRDCPSHGGSSGGSPSHRGTISALPDVARRFWTEHEHQVQHRDERIERRKTLGVLGVIVRHVLNRYAGRAKLLLVKVTGG